MAAAPVEVAWPRVVHPACFQARRIRVRHAPFGRWVKDRSWLTTTISASFGDTSGCSPLPAADATHPGAAALTATCRRLKNRSSQERMGSNPIPGTTTFDLDQSLGADKANAQLGATDGNRDGNPARRSPWPPRAHLRSDGGAGHSWHLRRHGTGELPQRPGPGPTELPIRMGHASKSAAPDSRTSRGAESPAPNYQERSTRCPASRSRGAERPVRLPPQSATLRSIPTPTAKLRTQIGRAKSLPQTSPRAGSERRKPGAVVPGLGAPSKCSWADDDCRVSVVAMSPGGDGDCDFPRSTSVYSPPA